MLSQKMTGKDVERILSLAQDIISLETPMGDDTDTVLSDCIKDPDPLPEDLVILADRHDTLIKYMEKYLTPREQMIIKMRFGFETGKEMSLESVGKIFNVSRERIRQIEGKAIRKLKIRFRTNNINRENL